MADRRQPTDSVTSSGPGHPEQVGKSKSAGGEHEKHRHAEPGRKDTAPKGRSRRPTGESSGRDSTAIDPENPIDTRSPNLR
jgi:hypothetical protein